VINKRFVCHRSVESHPIPQGNTYLSAYAVHGEVRLVRTAGEKPIAWFFEKRRQADGGQRRRPVISVSRCF
ncbi:hypothetical protein NKJ56_23870, partial [Mesorhizobium sp. M0093]